MADGIPSIKVVMLGNSGVGKTSLVNRFMGVKSEDPKPTIAATHFSKEIQLQDRTINMFLWDTAGQEQYQALTPLYTRGCSCALLVTSITDQASFDSIDSWIELMDKTCDNHPSVILTINKIDLDSNEKTRAQIQDQYSARFPNIFFVSAKTSENVEALFIQAAELGIPQISQLDNLNGKGNSNCKC